jgi:hypothetical protein
MLVGGDLASEPAAERKPFVDSRERKDTVQQKKIFESKLDHGILPKITESRTSFSI